MVAKSIARDNKFLYWKCMYERLLQEKKQELIIKLNCSDRASDVPADLVVIICLRWILLFIP